MNTIKIYSLIDSDNPKQTMQVFKGIEALRDFAIDKLYSGWETDITEPDLQDDETLINFLTKDYGCNVDILCEVFIENFKTIQP